MFYFFDTDNLACLFLSSIKSNKTKQLINYLSASIYSFEMKMRRFFNLLMMAIVTLFFTSCAPGSESFNVAPAGFLMGLWHGFISLFTFVISLFVDGVGIYEANNNGAWYNFGFILGVSIFFGGSSKGTCGKRK